MHKLYRFFASPVLALLLLVVFAVAMATATFVENDFGTATAWKVIYDSWWFELVMIGLAISFLTNIYKYKLWRKQKGAILLFHIAFIIILLGAGVTRYTSHSGIMRIREGSASNVIISDTNYLQVHISDGNTSKVIRKQLNFSPISTNDFIIKTDFNDIPVQISHNAFIADAVPEIQDEVVDGKPLLQLVVSSGNGRETIFLEKGEVEHIGKHHHKLGYNVKEEGVINIIEKNGDFSIQSPRDLDFFMMATQTAGTIKKDSLQRLTLRTLYRDGDASFVPISFHPKAAIVLVSESKKPKDNDKTKDDALIVDVQVADQKEESSLLYREGFLPTTHQLKLHGLVIELSYGAAAQQVPFSLYLNDFQLERYPGSTSPSAYASEVTILDNDIKKPYRIFMNNVLDYRGYRFFQASYDTDELGTVLSVNHDTLGTWITYLGYLFMGLGMFFTLFGKNSRFSVVNQKLKQLKQHQITVLFLLFLGTNFSIATTVDTDAEKKSITEQDIDAYHAALFGRIMVQDLDGRIKPINTLASEFLRKISRKTYFRYSNSRTEIRMNANQVFLAMHVDPNAWQQIPLIKIDQKKGGIILESLTPGENGLIPFTSLLDDKGAYILSEAVEKATLKKPAERTESDKEIIKVDERFNILYNVFSGNYLKIFPNGNDTNNTWYSYIHHFKDFPEEDATFVQTVIPAYFQDVVSKKWEAATDKLSYIKTYQDVLGKEIIPSDKRVAAELWYNELNLNFWLFQVFFTLGLILLVIAISKIFIQKRFLEHIWNIVVTLSLVSFLVFTGNILLRWYIAQHAPWSNGYEMLIFVAWVLLLCGLITFRKSDFSLPLATLFSGALLFVSYLDWLNPEITNLMPVLKSYWLKVHVATIVSSYAPLALSAVLGLMALILMIIKTDKTKKPIDIRIKELTYINEISMTIGLFVLAVGTFLGGVWANESWGRYWAWDPKETWALISIIVYAVVLHLRFIPGLQNRYILNVASTIAFWSIIMTSFGVNYYLSGLHSYAAGDPVPIPTFAYIIALLMILIIVTAYFRNKKWILKKEYQRDMSMDT
ncbi:cytochrome c biogenesis protein [Aquimarina sp. RZ0]|uniref:cytochrome c biogenesis protein n=1 Tax=Aquimarina sp. RZ0 TaxID=2607730 RepID=UPI0011F21FF2|nr:cytochrome c biogenesis protein CcsA [Aquimarina sp. RZ0]KAA1243323.1 cytochrome C biogenesis protein [Aquimarina sp. RZ0]